MTKAEIENLINTNLADGSGILAEQHREVEDALMNELYGTIFTEDRDTTSASSRITTPNGLKTSLLYRIHILKQGRLVIIKGFVWNKTSSIISNNLSNYFVFEIVDSEYLPDTSSTNTAFPIALGTFVELNRTGYPSENKFYCNQLASGQRITFNIQYFTKD